MDKPDPPTSGGIEHGPHRGPEGPNEEMRRLRVAYAANGMTANARYDMGPDRSLSVQVDMELTHVRIRDRSGRLRGAAWYPRTIRVLAGEAIDREVPG